jgi:DNA-directed RNA polymerase specialized sigma54-like protein
MEKIILKKTEIVNGIEFHLRTSMKSNGYKKITTIVSYPGTSNCSDGFQMETQYQGEESLKEHLDKVKTEMVSLAESLTGWKTVIEKLEEEGYTQVITE